MGYNYYPQIRFYSVPELLLVHIYCREGHAQGKFAGPPAGW